MKSKIRTSTIVRWMIIVLSLLMLPSCKNNIVEPAAGDPYTLWKSYNLHDYTIDQTRQCFCINGGMKVNIVVRSDTVCSVIVLSDNSLVLSPYSKLYLPIDSLFGIIRSRSGKDSLDITYNSVYGYPEKLDINPQQHSVDGGVLYVTSNLQPR
jgi:hypothetical protein